MRRGDGDGGWVPVVHRSYEAWIGIMPDGEIGVGTESEARASLKECGFVAMWPFLERTLDEFADPFTRSWPAFAGREPATPAELVEATVSSAWSSRSPYWMSLAAERALEMAERSAYDPAFLATIVGEMLKSQALSPEVRRGLRRWRRGTSENS